MDNTPENNADNTPKSVQESSQGTSNDVSQSASEANTQSAPQDGQQTAQQPEPQQNTAQSSVPQTAAPHSSGTQSSAPQSSAPQSASPQTAADSTAQATAQQQPPAPEQPMPSDYQYKISGSPDFARVAIQVPKGQVVKAEASAMISMDSNISMKTKFKGGFKRFLGGESLFINEFTAEQAGGQIEFASGLPGDIKHYHLDGNGESLFLQSGAFMAAGPDITLNTKFQGLIKGFFSGAGLFLIKCEGQGDIFFNSYGSIIPIDVKNQFIVDNNHIVAFTEGLEYDVQPVPSYKSFFLSGEALVTRFHGRGRVWIQTRKLPSFASWILPFRPTKNSN